VRTRSPPLAANGKFDRITLCAPCATRAMVGVQCSASRHLRVASLDTPDRPGMPRTRCRTGARTLRPYAPCQTATNRLRYATGIRNRSVASLQAPFGVRDGMRHIVRAIACHPRPSLPAPSRVTRSCPSPRLEMTGPGGRGPDCQPGRRAPVHRLTVIYSVGSSRFPFPATDA
jgi:hypothetical protein